LKKVTIGLIVIIKSSSNWDAPCTDGKILANTITDNSLYLKVDTRYIGRKI